MTRKKNTILYEFIIVCSTLAILSWSLLPSIRILMPYQYVSPICVLSIFFMFLSVPVKRFRTTFFITILLFALFSFMYFIIPYPGDIKKAINIFQIQILYFFPFFVTMYLLAIDNKKYMNIIIIFMSSCLSYILIKTSISLITNPHVVRALTSSHSGINQAQLFSENVGGFDFAYAVGFLTLFMCILFVKKKNKYIGVLFLFLMYVLIKFQFAINLFITLLFCYIAFIKSRYNKLVYIIFSILGFILSFFFIVSILLVITKYLPSDSIAHRLEQISSFFKGEIPIRDVGRMYCYIDGIKPFISSHLMGVYDMNSADPELYSNFRTAHSSILSILDEVGIIGFTIYLYNIIRMKNNIICCLKNKKYMYTIIIGMFITSMFFNYITEAMTLSSVVFLYIPIMMRQIDRKESKLEKEVGN